jgi:hypothetical protein
VDATPPDGRPGSLVARFGSAKRPDRPPAHPRPAGVTNEEVAAIGKLSEALEVVENARGLLYEFHRLSGTADQTLQEAVELLRTAGRGELAQDIERTLVGRDTIAGMWTFQVVENYDADYWKVFRATEQYAREQVGLGAPHVFEAEMKAREQEGLN